ncbi:alpha/beta hydrolase family protein [Raoultella ornithinolytica]|uniref:alpha/beta hydrolase family protein n=1 Tax=Klebsiella/Raoultella group TaxID=2890311 RepID=UPI000BA01B5A|nr:alpha/beta hydrolase [Raoultella planticola]ELK6031919.1 alpha/beta hydrolase [Raoultella ornithinolytica]HDX8758316.1 alpha/beta hydrolase [Klebsiella michiganensis]ELM7284144.1 alpha/beta hydrolase [Raoultella ornithinolytica]ELO0972891.1 alpha/beta hydrolase [Raoultella ornithinolytica]OZP75807.1 osmotically inducible protein OsmC [Raoultella planticola]
MKKLKFTFKNAEGEELAGLLELPENPKAFALLAHCFTCGKDLKGAARIARKLTENSIAVLRFDFTGLGNSEGDFSNTNFSSNISDLLCAVDYLRREYEAPSLLIGHSLGGSAILSIAGKVPEARAVVTIGSPGELTHVQRLFKDNIEDIRNHGAFPVELAGRVFTLKKQMLDNIQEHKIAQKVFTMNKPLLIFHAPNDDTVLIEQAEKIFKAARHPKSFISLGEADHLLTHPQDAEYVAGIIVAWSSAYI